MHGSHGTNGHHRRGWEAFLAALESSLSDLVDEDVSGLTRTTDLVDDLGLDSFAVLVLLDELEVRLAVSLPALHGQSTVGALFEAVELAPPSPVASAVEM
jgi:acyl carrier protein